MVFDTANQYPAAGYTTSQRPGGINKWSGRFKALALLSDNFHVTLAADYTYVDQPATASSALQIDPELGLAALWNAFSPPNSTPAAAATMRRLDEAKNEAEDRV